MKVVPMLQVADVEAASSWYQRVLGVVSGHGGDEFEMLFAGEPYATPLLLQLHRWEAHEHGFLGNPGLPIGNGASLWFELPDRSEYESLLARIASAGADVLEPSHWSPLAHHWEQTIRDLDGYIVVLHTPFEPGD